KPSGHDLREHKVTLPLIAAMAAMGPAQRREVEDFFAEPEPTDDGIARIVELVTNYGGLEYARQRADAFGTEAATALIGLPTSAAVESLHDAVSYVLGR